MKLLSLSLKTIKTIDITTYFQHMKENR